MKKNKYEDEQTGLPELAKGLITLVLVIVMFIGALKIGDWAERQDLERQYGDGIENVK